MKNNTKIRLHLSSTLFESIVKEVLAESKKMNMSGGAYTEAVKMPKKAKKMEEVNAVADTQKMQKMHKMDEKMSSKEKMAKGMYKEVDAVGDTEKMRKMYEISSKEKMAKGLYKEADMAKLKNAKAKIEKKLAEMEINVAEENKIEESRKFKSPTLSELRKKK
jgi:hypothetical protein